MRSSRRSSRRFRSRPIAYFARGPRNLTSNKPITHPDELSGVKIRVPNVPLFVDVWAALGAQPTPMAFSEVFTSLTEWHHRCAGKPAGTHPVRELQRSPVLCEPSPNMSAPGSILTISELAWNKLSAEDQGRRHEGSRSGSGP